MATAKNKRNETLDKILQKAGITREDLAGKQCSDQFITMVASMVPSYEDLAAYLNIGEVVTEDISRECRGEAEKKRRALKQWRSNKGGKATRLSLADIFLKMDNRTIAEEIVNLTKNPETDSEDETPPAKKTDHTSKSPQESKNSSLTVADIDTILEKLKETFVANSQWNALGIRLGLYQPTLSDIDDKNRGKPAKCMNDCLEAWLEGQDKARDPNWSSLVTALEKIGLNFAARKIKEEKC